jgi:hypothetical protein
MRAGRAFADAATSDGVEIRHERDAPYPRRGASVMTTGAQDTVERMISEGSRFQDIERYIETLPLPSEQLGALWLLAWAEATDPLMRRQIVAEALAGDDHLPAPLPGAAASSSARAPHDERPLESVRRVRSYSERGVRERRRPR